jgi:aminoglycoside phosphotransferase family enzyme/predicted kinase
MNKCIVPVTKTEAILEFLLDPESYEEKPLTVESIETHISWVFLTEKFAYKLKKPVRFDFLDFSTPQRRCKACEEEIRLNRRLTRNVYLGVIPITEQCGELSLGGEGTAVDWVVKMRRLPADRALDKLIRTRTVTGSEVRQVGHLLSQFYDRLPPLMIRTDAYRSGIEDHVRKNRCELLDTRHGLNRAVIRRVHELQLRQLVLAPKTLDDRVLDGRIVEGHGDLRPEHIYLAPTPMIIDCIEFNAEFRQLDVLDELAFFAMECATLDAEWIGDEILHEYCTVNNDKPAVELLSFYKSYRACVRAKASALRAEQVTGNERQETLETAKRYLHLADSYCRQLGPPLLLVVRGLTGTGKSTLAAELAELFGIEHLQTDAIRRELYGKSEQPAEYGKGLYQPQSRSRVYDELFHRAASKLDEGLSVILDGTFLTAKSRSDAVALAQSKHAVPLVIHCHCDDEVARQRITARIESGDSLSESREDVFFVQKREDEPDPADLPVCNVDTETAQPAVLKIIVQRLKASLACSH